MSDDPFAAFTADVSKKGVTRDDPFSILNTSSSGGTDPFASFSAPTVSSVPKPQDSFDPFGLPTKGSGENDPFSAFKPAAGVDPFAASNISSDPFGQIAMTSIETSAPPVVDPFSMQSEMAGLLSKSAQISVRPTVVEPSKSHFSSSNIDSDPFSGIEKNLDPFAAIALPKTSSSVGNIHTSKSVDSSIDRPADLALRSSPVARPRASVGASVDAVAVGERFDPPRNPDGGPAQLSRSTPPMSPPQVKLLTKPPPPPKAEKPAKILASNFTSKPSPPPPVDKSISRTAPPLDVADSDPEGPQQPKKNRQTMRHGAYSGPKTYSSDKSTGPFWRQHAFFDIFIGMPRSQFISDDPDSSLHPVRRIRNMCHTMHTAISSQISCFSSSLVPIIPAVTKSILTALYEATILFDLFPYPLDPASIYAFLNHFIVRLRGMRLSEFLLFPCSWTAENDS